MNSPARIAWRRWFVVAGVVLVAVAGAWFLRLRFGGGVPPTPACPNYTLLTQRLTGSTWDIFGLDPQAGVEINLTAMAGDDTTPAWNPAQDRRNFAFVSQRDGNSEIYRLDCGNLGQTSLVRVTNQLDEDIDPAWSGDNRLAFASNRERVNGQPRYSIFRSFDSGSSITRVSPRADCDARQPAWSPDGNWIAYTSDCTPNRLWQLFVISSIGGTAMQVTNHPSLNSGKPVWKPDGSLIAYVRYESGPQQARIWLIAPDGSGERQLRPGSPDDEFDPRWTPDGAEVTFVTYTGGTNLDVYAIEPTLDAAGTPDGTLRQITSSPRDDRAPDWVR